MISVSSLSILPTPLWPTGTSEALVQLWHIGFTTTEIADYFDKTLRSVDSKIRALRMYGVDLPKRRFDNRAIKTRQELIESGYASRRCLYCGAFFDSSHKGNRLCLDCLEHGPFTSSIL